MMALALVTVAVMLGAALAVVLLRNLLAAVAAASLVSLALSVLLLLLQAPDVALTEAAVGAGLTGVLFAITLFKLGLTRNGGDS